MSYRLILLVIIMLAACPVFVWGNEFRILPSISVKEEYNSNVFVTPNDKKDDFITTISPGLEIVNRTERLDTDVLIRMDRIEYISNKDLSTTDQTYNGRLRYLATPLLSVSAEAGYVKDSRADRDIGTTGIVLSAVPRDRINSSLSADYQLTEKTSAGLSYIYGRDHYADPKFIGDTTHAINAGLVYDLGTYFPTLKGRLNTGYSYYSFLDSRIESFMGTVGFSRDFNEIWSIQVDGGVRRTSSDITTTRLEPVYFYIFGFPIQIGNQLVKDQVKNAGWGWVGSASLNFKGEHGAGSLSLSRDVQPASGLGGATVRDSLVLSAQHNISYELLLLFNAGYFTNKSNAQEFSSQTINQRSFHFNPGVRYEFSKDMFMEGSYDYIMVDDMASKTNVDRHLYSLRLYIQHAVLE